MAPSTTKPDAAGNASAAQKGRRRRGLLIGIALLGAATIALRDRLGPMFRDARIFARPATIRGPCQPRALLWNTTKCVDELEFVHIPKNGGTTARTDFPTDRAQRSAQRHRLSKSPLPDLGHRETCNFWHIPPRYFAKLGKANPWRSKWKNVCVVRTEPSGDRVRRSWRCYVLQEDDARSPTLQR